jgi:hypothetical protein
MLTTGCPKRVQKAQFTFHELNRLNRVGPGISTYSSYICMEEDKASKSPRTNHHGPGGSIPLPLPAARQQRPCQQLDADRASTILTVRLIPGCSTLSQLYPLLTEWSGNLLNVMH